MPHSRPAADSHEIRGLTGIRGLAAIMVASFHFYFSWVLLLPALSLVRAPLLRGYLGVDLFFMLSGFILSYVYHAGGRNFTGREYGRFLWFRLARLYPNHVGMLLLLIVLFYGSKFLGIHTTFSCAWDDLPFQLTLTQEWPIAPREGAGEWNFPAWSISAEWFAYLAIFPLVAFLLRRIRGWQLPLLLGGATVVAWSMVGPHLWPREYQLARVACEFFCGGMFFSVFLHGRAVTGFCQRFLSWIFVLLLVLLFLPSSLGTEILTLATLPLLLLGLTSDVSPAGKFFSTPLILWLGKISYALYMSHALVQKVLKILVNSEHYAHSSFPVRLLIFFVNIASLLAMAAALYYFVEVPARNRLRRFRLPWAGVPGRRLE
jgi:peptidoglycan/LPS O-acetylase OafA/YrhL